MKASEIREMTDKELSAKLKQLKQELFNLRFANATGQLSNPMQINNCRKNIAKVQTIMAERLAKKEA